MNRLTGSDTSEAEPSRFARIWPPLVLVLAGLAAYSGSFAGALVFDDRGSIVDNLTIRRLWPLGTVLSPPAGGLTVSGRPVLNLTLALNYALGGTRVWGYHAVNVAIHLFAGLVLYGIVRRTLERDRRKRDRALVLAWAVALLWTLHPVQTEAVTYVVQRAESLMGLFYLLTLYCFIRRWYVLSVLACLLGMGTKEVMVSAPILVLLYDRTFWAGSLGEAWRRRRSLYLGLAATWILLGYLVIGGGGGRSGSVGFGVDVSWWAYGLTQFQAIAHYLKLAVWPHPLVFEYGTFWVENVGQVVLPACLVITLVAATVVALGRWPVAGFLGFGFFAILAPTSLVPGTTQMIVEHRLYLALVPVLVMIVCGGEAWIERVGRSAARRSAITGDEPPATWGRGSAAWVAVLVVLAGMGGVLAARRNEDYRSEVALWTDTVAQRPENALAHNNLGTALEREPGRLPEAIAQYREALRLNPAFHEAHNNLGNAWLKTPGKFNEAVAQYQEAIRLRPDFAEAHDDLGNAWSQVPGRLNEAIAEYQQALRLKPGDAGAHNNLGKAWLSVPGRMDEAVAQFEEALRLNPDFAEAHDNLGAAWVNSPGKLTEAIAQFEAAVRLNPGLAEAHNNLGNAWSNLPGRQDEAVAQLREALRLNPNYPEAHNNLGNVWALQPGRSDEAVAQYQEALRLRPDYAEAHFNLASILLQLPGRREEARSHLEAFLRLRPDNEEARQALASLPASPP